MSQIDGKIIEQEKQSNFAKKNIVKLVLTSLLIIILNLLIAIFLLEAIRNLPLVEGFSFVGYLGDGLAFLMGVGYYVVFVGILSFYFSYISCKKYSEFIMFFMLIHLCFMYFYLLANIIFRTACFTYDEKLNIKVNFFTVDNNLIRIEEYPFIYVFGAPFVLTVIVTYMVRKWYFKRSGC